MTAPSPPPGWYPDPSGAPGQRYFDGTQWTDHRAAASPHMPALTPAPKKSRPWLWVIGSVVVLLLFFGGCATLLAVNSDAPGVRKGPATIGSHVSDGKFDFVVNSVRRTTESAGLSQPRGEWVIVSMTVMNAGDEPQGFFPNNQKLRDAAGREYAADAMAAMAMNQDAVVWDLNPGFNITVDVPFDVPPGTQVSEIELHDSAFSGGTTVNLK